MRRSPALLVLLLAACSSGTPKALVTASPSSSPSPSPTLEATSAAPLPLATKARATASATPSQTRATRPSSPSASPTSRPRTPTPSPKPSPKPSATRNGQTFAIDEVTGDRFSPRTLTIRVGDSVLVTNKDVGSHTFTIASLGKDSGNMDSGDTYKLRFGSAGTFHFICSYHDSSFNMNGDITVRP